MIASLQSAEYDPTTGKIKILINNSTINGYQNTISNYTCPNVMSVPVSTNPINIDVQSATQMVMTGQNNRIIDSNYTIAPGEFTAYSQNWYTSTRNGGVEVQQANTANKENLMAGQSTNSVLSDIMDLLSAIVTYLGTHTHTGGTISGNTGPVVTPPPSDTDILDDITYIDANKNLFITGTYEPK